MSTRRRTEGSAPAVNGYMSSPVYASARGIGGTEATAKASMLLSARCRCLIFFLQALSWRKGGLRKVADDVIALFPERIGTPTMHRLGVKPGRVYSEKDARQIKAELASEFSSLGSACGEFEGENLFSDEPFKPEPIPCEERTAEYFLALCHRRVAQLETLLVELCVDPLVECNAPEMETADVDRESLLHANPDLNLSQFRPAGLTWFHDITGALLEFQARHAAEARARLADTEVAGKVLPAMDRALRRRRMVQIIGEPGVGKTESVKTWTEMHLGEARLVTLSGINEQTGFFQRIAEALGVASGTSQSLPKMKARVEAMLRRSGLMLVIDESHFMFSPHERVRSRPVLLDWVDTACCNNGVPVVLSATPQFTAHLKQLQTQSIGKLGLWNSAQFHRRCLDRLPLPARVPPKDARAVVLKLWPEASAAHAAEIVVWATAGKASQNWPLSWIRDLLDDARELATEDRREMIQWRDVQRAFKEVREPSDLALVEALADTRTPRRAAPLQPPCKGREVALPAPETEEDLESRSRIGSRQNTRADTTLLTTG